MRVGSRIRKRVPGVAVALLMGIAGVTQAQFPHTLQQSGRIHGFGWGDGYHACKSSPPRWREDLPPGQADLGHRLRPNGSARQLVHRMGGTFYDRFDAANNRLAARRCDAARCDAAPCDGGGCDSPCCTVIDGSQVTREPHAPTPPQELPQPVPAEAVPADPGPVPDVVPQDAAIPRPASPIPAEVSPPQADRSVSLAPATPKRPVRPEPPAYVAPRLITVPVLAEPAPGDSVASTIDPQPVAAEVVKPVMPTAPISEAMVKPQPPSPAEVAEIVLPKTTPVTVPTLTEPAISKPAISETVISEPVISEPVINKLAAPASQGFVPSYARTAPGESPPAPTSRPRRLGTKSDPAPSSGLVMPSVTSPRPTRLGSPSNQAPTRPLVEMADRSGDSVGGFIRQPDSGSFR